MTHALVRPLLCVLLSLWPVLLLAEDWPLVGPKLGAASNFAQGKQPRMIRLAPEFGVTLFRDGMSWTRAERSLGVVQFTDQRNTFPDILADSGGEVSLVLNWGNPLYDDGDTPYSDEAVAAFGRFAADIAQRFDNMESLEVGNEFNGNNFVRGPIRGMPPRERAQAYVALLQSASVQARAVRPDLRILGGAAHSIPAGYLWEVLDAGGADYMDALAIHPYTTPAEQFVRQLEVLRQHPRARNLPVEITEFGNPNPARAAGHLLRNYCQFALAGGVTQVIWYPLNPRDDGLVHLLDRNGQITTAGQAYKLVQSTMESEPVRPYQADPFTYGCYFGDHTLVLWGEPRELDVAPGVEVLSPTGQPLSPPFRTNMDNPLVIRSEQGLPSDVVTLADHGIRADSFHQFTYDTPETDGFDRFAMRSGQRVDLETLPGQQARGTIWTPYLGHSRVGVARLGPEALRPAKVAGQTVEIVHHYVASAAETVDIEASFRAAENSADGITVDIRRGSDVLFSDQGKQPIDVDLEAITLAKGDELAFVVGPGETGTGDGVRYRITVRNAQ